MQEASGIDLDWFWHGWFYSTDHVDISIDKVYQLRLDTLNPDIDLDRRRAEHEAEPGSLFVSRNQAERIKTWVELNKDINDFHDKYDRFTPSNKDRSKYQKLLAELEPIEKAVMERALDEDKNYYVMNFSNLGGLVMPILLSLTYEDGSDEELYIPAEIWRKDPLKVSKLLVTDKNKQLKSVVVDVGWETADVDIENNHYPRQIIPSRIEMFKQEKSKNLEHKDLMHDIKTPIKKPEAKKYKK